MDPSLLTRLSDNHPLSKEDDYHWVPEPCDELLRELKILLMSRTRMPDIEELSLINTSVLNYGIYESFANISEINNHRVVLEKKLKNAIARFEPRLSKISLSSLIDSSRVISFILRGLYGSTPVQLELKYTVCTGRFDFNE